MIEVGDLVRIKNKDDILYGFIFEVTRIILYSAIDLPVVCILDIYGVVCARFFEDLELYEPYEFYYEGEENMDKLIVIGKFEKDNSEWTEAKTFEKNTPIKDVFEWLNKGPGKPKHLKILEDI